MAYSEHTFSDPNPIKRWLQHQRLDTALMLAGEFAKPQPKAICDYGAGNGELCKHLFKAYGCSDIVCFEPTPQLMQEAKVNLGQTGFPVLFASSLIDLKQHKFDLIFCLEVFEHLLPKEMTEASDQIQMMLGSDGVGVIGVPVEIGLPAAYKGLFRMRRRFGAFDATIRNVTAAILGKPPRSRPIAELAPGIPVYPDHLGFNYREFQSFLEQRFRVLKISGSPFKWLGAWGSPEIYFVITNRPTSPQR